MAIQEWSDTIRVVQLSDDPQFTEDLCALEEDLEAKPTHVVLNFAAVGFINSSNIARLLRLRKKMLSIEKHMVLCEASTQVWSVFLVTGLDRVFDFVKDVSTALAKVQLGEK